MRLFNWIFKKKYNWERLDNNHIPNWLWNKVYSFSPNIENYYNGKHFRYKVIKLPGNRQGEYKYKFYRKIKSY